MDEFEEFEDDALEVDPDLWGDQRIEEQMYWDDLTP